MKKIENLSLQETKEAFEYALKNGVKRIVDNPTKLVSIMRLLLKGKPGNFKIQKGDIYYHPGPGSGSEYKSDSGPSKQSPVEHGLGIAYKTKHLIRGNETKPKKRGEWYEPWWSTPIHWDCDGVKAEGNLPRYFFVLA